MIEHCQRYEPGGHFHMSVHIIKVELPLSLPKDNSISLPMAMIMAMIICRRVWHMSILKVFAIVLIIFVAI